MSQTTIQHTGDRMTGEATKHTHAPAPSTLDLAPVRAVVSEHFPDYWPAVEVGLSVCATLVLADNANPVAVIYVGNSGTGKTTVASLFDGHPRVYRSDDFTPAAFVSHSAAASAKQLDKIDLLPKIKGKVLVTPEMAPVFRGDEKDLEKRFAILTRVLDGHGLQRDTGTHGARGYSGDYLFAWLGCTTPIPDRTWRIMAQLGSRLFFWRMDDQHARGGASDGTVDALIASMQGTPYLFKTEQCKTAVHRFLTRFFDHYGGFRKVTWDYSQTPREVLERLARWAQLVAAMRSAFIYEDGQVTVMEPEDPKRALAVLHNLARGHALVHGRTSLSAADLPVAAHVAVSSSPANEGRALMAIARRPGEPLTVAEVGEVLPVKHPETVRKALRALDARRLVTFTEAGTGRAAQVRLREEWAWCSELPDLLDAAD